MSLDCSPCDFDRTYRTNPRLLTTVPRGAQSGPVARFSAEDRGKSTQNWHLREVGIDAEPNAFHHGLLVASIVGLFAVGAVALNTSEPVVGTSVARRGRINKITVFELLIAVPARPTVVRRE